MKNTPLTATYSNNSLLCAGSVLLASLLPSAAFAQLPKPTYGWNLGNTMEPPSGVGTWGGSPSQALIYSVAKAGFNTVRIPCAWDSHADKTTHIIDPAYMAQVKQVVDWCYERRLYVVINDHWDGGWLENHLTGKFNPAIDAKMKSYWTQIATAFSGYDHKLLFAAANEPNVKTAGQMAELAAYYQTFVNCVRGAGANNKERWLVLQGPSTNIDITDTLMTSLPTDPTTNRLMLEVHFYDPYQFCLMPSDQPWGKVFYFWGQGYHSATLPSRNPTSAEESSVDTEFQKMFDKFVSKGIPVIVGELRAEPHAAKSDLTGTNLELSRASSTYWDKYVFDSAQSHGLSPICWDTPGSIFNFKTGELVDPAAARAMTGGAASPPPGGDGAQYGFELGTQGVVSSGAPITSLVQSTTRKYAGNQSLAINFGGGPGATSISAASPSVPAGRKITFHIWIPSGSTISVVHPYVIDHRGVWVGISKPISSIRPDAWNTFTLPVPKTAATPLRQLGVRFKTTSKWSGTCFVDSIGW